MDVEDFRIRRCGDNPGLPDTAVFADLFGVDATAEDVQVFDVTFPPATRLGFHWHTQGLVAAVTRGSVEFVFDSEAITLDAGDYIWIRSSVPHDERSQQGVSMTVAHLAAFDSIYP